MLVRLQYLYNVCALRSHLIPDAMWSSLVLDVTYAMRGREWNESWRNFKRYLAQNRNIDLVFHLLQATLEYFLRMSSAMKYDGFCESSPDVPLKTKEKAS